MTPDRIVAQRLRAHRLTSASLRSPHAVVGWLGAVQAQEYGVAKWSVGQRMRAATDAAVERAYAEGSILRTHVLRPTWHFVLPADIRWMVELTAPRVRARMAGQHRRIDLPDSLFARANAVIARALEDGVHMTRSEVQAVLARGGIDVSGQRLGHVLMMAELDAVVCSGAPRGKQHTYALLEQRAPNARSLDPDDALAELARRYFASHGPASVPDLARWATLTQAEAARALALLGTEAEPFDQATRSVKWWRSGVPPRLAPHAPAAHLLQVYDEFIGGYGAPSRRLIDPADLMHAMPAMRTPFMHAVVLDGRVIGHWRPSQRGAAGAVDMKLAVRLDAGGREAVEQAVARYRQFLSDRS